MSSSDDRDDVCGRVSCDDVRSIDELCDVLVHECVSDDDVCNRLSDRLSDGLSDQVSDGLSDRMLSDSHVLSRRVLCGNHLVLPCDGSVPGCQGDA